MFAIINWKCQKRKDDLLKTAHKIIFGGNMAYPHPQNRRGNVATPQIDHELHHSHLLGVDVSTCAFNARLYFLVPDRHISA